MKTKTMIMQNMVAATVAGAAFMASSSVQACELEPFVGSICITAAPFCPSPMYVEANGALLPINANTTLFSLLGTTYGGDGRTSFALPDLRGRTPVGQGAAPGLSPVKQGELRGVEQATLTTENMPSHTHSLNVVNSDGTGPVAAGAWIANPKSSAREVTVSGYATRGTTVALSSGTVGSAGASTPVNNIPPQLGLRYCIATTGIYPSRP